MSVFTNPASSSVEQAKAYTTAILGLLDRSDPLEVLEQTPSFLRVATNGLSDQQLRTRESPGKWSFNQVLQHLADSELVWGYRLRMVLAQERPPLMGYDQDLWSERLGYDDADADQALETFSLLRRNNLQLLRRMHSADLMRVGVHTERGEESVQHMIRLYAGHDLLHLRQLERIRSAVEGAR